MARRMLIDELEDSAAMVAQRFRNGQHDSTAPHVAQVFERGGEFDWAACASRGLRPKARDRARGITDHGRAEQ